MQSIKNECVGQFVVFGEHHLEYLVREYARIQGELKKLGITVAANTIKKIMIKNGFHPSPNRTKGDWDGHD